MKQSENRRRRIHHSGRRGRNRTLSCRLPYERADQSVDHRQPRMVHGIVRDGLICRGDPFQELFVTWVQEDYTISTQRNPRLEVQYD